MTREIDLRTLAIIICALKKVHRQHEDFQGSETDTGIHDEYLIDLERALDVLAPIYEEKRGRGSNFSSFDDL